MAYDHYDRLEAVDSLFLDIEAPNVHMHVAAVALFDARPLTDADGIFDVERIRNGLAASLAGSPRFRQRLTSVPWFEQPVWVDDENFNLHYHVRHTALPRPGAIRALKRLAGRVLSQKLDRGKPLWEFWIVEGVEGGRFALIVKAHHCMVDGISGIDLLAGILRPDPDPTMHPPDRKWIPRPAPTAARLFSDELVRRWTWPLKALGAGGRAVSDPNRLLGDLREGVLGLGEVLKAGLVPTASTPLNPDIGPHRRFDWARLDMSAVKEVRARFGGTVNDVVLATAAGAVGRFLQRRGVSLGDGVFRAQVPMSIRKPSERGEAGNRVVMLMADLPVTERDPRRRLERMSETTRRLKRSRQRVGVEFLEEVSSRAWPAAFLWFARLATWQRSFNLVVTNVPGPPIPLYLCGARLLEIYPLVPLAYNQALGIALFSYDGSLYWGFNADWESLPDLHDFVEGLELEFEGMRKAAAGGS
ncbi:MAG: wax ester/triacylglycerol synthase family O-acyltransferase [Myxococcota bacterium]|nr:wax ester/triacylglycerol synthase family O-acyltransferase [Myxococcota bacterium]